jgi:rhodanese-related sulfurtransferase
MICIKMMVSRRNSVIVITLVAILAVIAGLYTPKIMNWGDNKDGNFGEVSIQEAIKLIEQKSDMVILDVRTVGEFESGHIEGAINVPVEELAGRLEEIDKNDELLVYCRTGNRSGNAVNILSDAGYTKIYHMHEGISVWIQKGHPVVQ